MTDWKAVAAAIEPRIPEDAVARAAPVLERLEAALQSLEAGVPIDVLPWNSGEGQR